MPNMVDAAMTGYELKALRLTLDLSPAELGHQLGFTEAHVLAYEDRNLPVGPEYQERLILLCGLNAYQGLPPRKRKGTDPKL